MSDIPFSPMPEWELYGKVGAMVRSAGIGRFVGVGERISACRDAFGAGSEFYRTAEEFIRHCTQDSLAGRAILLRGNSDTGSSASCINSTAAAIRLCWRWTSTP